VERIAFVQARLGDRDHHVRTSSQRKNRVRGEGRLHALRSCLSVHCTNESVSESEVKRCFLGMECGNGYANMDESLQQRRMAMSGQGWSGHGSGDVFGESGAVDRLGGAALPRSRMARR